MSSVLLILHYFHTLTPSKGIYNLVQLLLGVVVSCRIDLSEWSLVLSKESILADISYVMRLLVYFVALTPRRLVSQ